MSEAGTVNSLVAELLNNGRAKANNVVKLLALIQSCKQESALKAVIQGLKQFFVAAGQDGLLAEAAAAAAPPAKRHKADTDPATAPPPAPEPAHDDPEAQYRIWLGRQYGKFVELMLLLATGSPATSPAAPEPPAAAGGAVAPAAAAPGVGGGVSAGVALAAAAALMECVRSELGPGRFGGVLYGRLLSGVLLSRGAPSQVYALLFTKYLAMADVRFHTLATVRAVLAQYGSRLPQGGATEEEEEREAAAGAAAAVESTSGGSGGLVSLADLCRNAYDVLTHLPECLPADVSEWSSWCGAAEYQLVTPAPDKNESARNRRKRQQQQRAAAAEGGQGMQPGGQQRALWANAVSQRRLYGDAWLSLLSLPLPPDLLRKALLLLPRAVLPHMPSPHLLADLLTHCLGRGGLTGMLALNGLFLLVTRHGLEYPQFYARLYQLLVPEAFAARSRSQFFRLADLFLSSSLVPAYTVAAFVKRFARLALTAPPAGALIAIAFIHNLLRRHPTLSVMLHNPAAAAAGGEGAGVDPYEEALDPALSRAVESSLWEVEALRRHYCPQVSTFCAVLDKDLSDRTKTAEVNLDDLMGAAKREGQQQAGGAVSYSALIQGELTRKLRKAPIAFYSHLPSGLFSDTDSEDWAGWTLEYQGER